MEDIRETGNVGVYGKMHFDPKKEPFILEQIYAMTHKGQKSSFKNYVETVIRAAMENPESITKNNTLISKMLQLGGTPKATEFYEEMNREVKEMHREIDEMYRICRDMSLMVKAGQSLGLEQKVDNMLLTQFIAQRNLKTMTEKFGLTDINVFESDKNSKIDAIAESVVEYIVEHYSNIINAIKISQQQVTISTPVHGSFDTSAGNSKEIVEANKEESKKEEVKTEETKSNNQPNKMFSIKEIEEDEPIDLNALSGLIGLVSSSNL